MGKAKKRKIPRLRGSQQGKRPEKAMTEWALTAATDALLVNSTVSQHLFFFFFFCWF